MAGQSENSEDSIRSDYSWRLDTVIKQRRAWRMKEGKKGQLHRISSQ